VLRKPDWIRVRVPSLEPELAETRRIVREHKPAHGVRGGGCPNIGECWTKRHATMMIMGDTCTRACAFCNVRTGLPGRSIRRARATWPRRAPSSASTTSSSPRSIATICRRRRGHFRRDHPRHPRQTPETTIEVLTPDFLRKDGALEIVVAARPTCSTTTSRRCRRTT
jgi:lipoic acid synthetase